MSSFQQIHNKWTLKDAEDTYGIDAWGNGYFHIDKNGEVIVTPSGEKGGSKVSMMQIMQDIRERGWSLPVLLRFEGILYSRIKAINESFRKAIKEYKYTGDYRGVYPIKVNQQQQVIEELSTYGKEFHHGLEAGSKPELIAAMAFLNDPEALLICNGYKDEEFIDLGLSARKLGINCIFVIETVQEVQLILKRSEKLGIRPVLGLRMKLSSSGSGHWKESGGDRSVFGLNTYQVMQVVDDLKAENALDCLQLLHFHLGSQLPNIRDIRNAATEACRVYCGLAQEGAPMSMLDLGGGLAVDYDGSHTNSNSSCNYTLDEYARDMVEIIKGVVDEAELKHPRIITESGRATVAYYSVLLFNILEVSKFSVAGDLPEVEENSHELTSNIHYTAKSITAKNLQESFHDAIYYRDEIRTLFRHGQIGIRERATVEEIFWYTMLKIRERMGKLRQPPRDLEDLESALSDIYYGNLSVFQSIPDSWAIDQLFPLMPIHRLNEAPTRNGIIADITCDCDGKIDRFIDKTDVSPTLPLHELKDGEDYILGAFLVGAYQETLGDLHNLFGDTNVVGIRFDEDGELEYFHELEGDTVADVLEYVEYDPKDLVRRFREMAERAVKKQVISGPERKSIMALYQEGLRGYTYHEPENA
ncbi:biosynthetic arginine decarboxylase [Puniceicoccales bacterium CK1056]|uniref:Biosynthetic arginine decarboxylase n=1 Tax=Oceanipulchritudo coccoides TaxID=2706888 RepID=A0A6B2M515_9BACT|nr:biosynthetic arginine decarboxylase [Oceanipulchritudo coccoides]NDV62730.1 biosynthetic arginine decarboxylase [Oceanipulchritudo coccoides]